MENKRKMQIAALAILVPLAPFMIFAERLGPLAFFVCFLTLMVCSSALLMYAQKRYPVTEATDEMFKEINYIAMSYAGNLVLLIISFIAIMLVVFGDTMEPIAAKSVGFIALALEVVFLYTWIGTRHILIKRRSKNEE